MMKRDKLIRLTTIDGSLGGLLKGQLAFLNHYFEVVGVADDSGKLAAIGEREGIRTAGIPMRREISPVADIKSLWALIRLFRRERPFIVHANTPKASLLSMIAAWITRVPNRIYTVTGLRFETAHGAFRFVLKTMERITCFCATKVIPEGDGVRDTLRREHITRKPLHKILNGNITGVDVDYFDRTDDVMRQASALRGAGFHFVFVGRIVKDKGVDELVTAFDLLSRECGDVKLMLVGRFEDNLDPVSAETKYLIDRNDRILCMGYQSDVRPYLAASDALVLPSYREGFPNVVLQAGAMGLPSIVTDINGCNEIIIEGCNGVIISKQDMPALLDAMRCFVNQPERTRKMSAESRPQIVSRFRQQDVWNALLEMYKSLE